jgi:hydroxymethylpyrimidine pyrophosphatase-like HAD family hydrolase
METRKRIIAVDFDGTIVEDDYPNIGTPNDYIIKKLKDFKKHGDILILWTCRVGDKLNEAVKWCEQQGLLFDYVNENSQYFIDLYGSDSRKIFADYYIDDKASAFTDNPTLII